MNILRRAWERIREFFEKAEPSQRYSLIALSAVVLFSLVWVVVLSARDDMVLFAEGASAEDRGAVLQYMDESAIPYELRSGQIFVPSDQKDRLVMDLQVSGRLPDSVNVFDWLNEADFLSTAKQMDLKVRVSLQRRIEQMLRSLKKVDAASVQISMPEEKFFVELTNKRTTAAVKLKLRDTLSNKEAKGIASMVANSVGDMKIDDVTIMDQNMKNYRIASEDNGFGDAEDGYLIARQEEAKLIEKVRDHMAKFLPDFGVAASYIIKTETSVVHSDKWEEKPWNHESDMVREESKNTTRAGGFDGGLGPITPPSIGNNSVESEYSRTEQSSKAIRDHIVTQTQIRPGDVKTASVTLTVPAAFASDIEKHAFLLADEPNLASMTDEQKKAAILKKNVDSWTKHLRAVDPNIASVSVLPVWFPPIPEIHMPTTMDHIKEFMLLNGMSMILAIVALIALAMILRLIRQSMPTDLQAEMARIKSELEKEQVVSHEAAMAETEELKMNQMKRAIKDMVNRNPRTVANMLKRWLG